MSLDVTDAPVPNTTENLIRSLEEAYNTKPPSKIRQTVSDIINHIPRIIPMPESFLPLPGSEDLRWAFDSNIKTIFTMVEKQAKINNGYEDGPIVEFTIDGVNFLMMIGTSNESTPFISIEIPKGNYKTYKRSKPNSAAVLEKIIAFIANSDDYKKYNRHQEL